MSALAWWVLGYLAVGTLFVEVVAWNEGRHHRMTNKVHMIAIYVGWLPFTLWIIFDEVRKAWTSR